ncbi:MAG: NUDIX hydrolase [Solirubrobacterales bacterium]|nr:NUDIX hydrolase [Solirubrobacterales bacterium]
MSDAPAFARPAATVILASRGRKHGEAGLEVLLCRRTHEARFMPGVWVFPGGAVEPGDALDGELDTEQAHRACVIRELAEETGIELDRDAELVPWSRWITPEPVPVRFDTRFYLALAPAHAKARIDGREIVDSAWISPADALASSERGELELVFPTIKNLEALAPHATAAEAFDAARRAQVETILPKVLGSRESHRIVLPGDPDY